MREDGSIWGNFQVSCLRDEWVVVLFTRSRKSRGGGFVNDFGHAALGACSTSGWVCTCWWMWAGGDSVSLDDITGRNCSEGNLREFEDYRAKN